MKVLHVAPSLSRAYGGPTYSLAAFARAALESGAELTIAGPAPSTPDSWLASTLPEVDICAFRTFGRGAFLASPALHEWLRAHGSRFDVMHIHGLLNPISSLTARTCVKKGWPAIIRPFGTMSRYTYAHRRGTMKRLYRALIDRPNLERVSAVHFTTTVERTESMWQGIEWNERAYVIPPPWLEGAPHVEPRKSSDSPTVLFVSRLHPVKRVELLIDAWAEVLRLVPNAKLVIAGEGSLGYVHGLHVRAQRSGVEVTFPGFVEGDAKRELLAGADVFVLPSLHENFGIAVLEALADGLPVVITPEVQLSGFVREHALGIVAEGNASALAESVAAALNDSVLRKRCRTQGAALVSRYFSPSAIGVQLLDMYRFATEHPPA